MANISLATHGGEPDDHSMFAWLISAMIIAASIFVNIVWKLLMTCYHRSVIQYGDANHVHYERGSGRLVEKNMYRHKLLKTMVAIMVLDQYM